MGGSPALEELRPGSNTRGKSTHIFDTQGTDTCALSGYARSGWRVDIHPHPGWGSTGDFCRAWARARRCGARRRFEALADLAASSPTSSRRGSSDRLSSPKTRSKSGVVR